MFSNEPLQFKIALRLTAFALTLVIGLASSFVVKADHHYISLKKFFPNGKCSPVIPNYEAMKAGFAGGELTKFEIRDAQGKVIETISTFVNKIHDQWAIVGSKTDRKVIFCLYTSGSGKGSVDRRTIK